MRNEITTIIFSKNRACQLELLLRNLNMQASVIYTHDEDLGEGYKKLIGMYPGVNFVKEVDFKKQIIEMVGDYTMFLCDDDIMIEHFDENCPEFIEFKNNPEIICLSLRMAPYYKRAPEITNNTWKWKNEPKDWGYPMSVTSHIFRKDDILPVMEREDFTNPNNLEVKLRRNAPDRPLMMCFDKPKTINNLANRVQERFLNPNVYGAPLVDLEKNFLEGKLLSLKYIQEKAKSSNCCFLSTDFAWGDNWLSQYKRNVVSQRGEDGILEKIFEILDIKEGYCVDVGAYGKQLSNTYNLISQGWNGILFEMDKQKSMNITKLYKDHDNVYNINKEIRPDGFNTLENLLGYTSLHHDFDFLTIDIDGNDYYVWESLIKYTPKVIVIEFNPTFDFDEYLQPVDGEGGASLKTMIQLGKEKDYELMTTTEFNAFFIRKDLFKKFGIINNSIEEMFVKNNDNYGGKTRKDIKI